MSVRWNRLFSRVRVVCQCCAIALVLLSFYVMITADPPTRKSRTDPTGVAHTSTAFVIDTTVPAFDVGSRGAAFHNVGCGLFRSVESRLNPAAVHCTHSRKDHVSAQLHAKGYLTHCLLSVYLALDVFTHTAGTLKDTFSRRSPQALIFDVGANIGGCTIAFASRVPSPPWHVVAMEPTQRNADVLHQSVFASGLGHRVTVVRAAAWSPRHPDEHGAVGTPRTRKMFSDEHNRGGAVILPDDVAASLPLSSVEVDVVQLTTLDEQLERFRSGLGSEVASHLKEVDVQFVKLDAEGTELQALHGASSLFSGKSALRAPPMALIEVDPRLSFATGNSPEELVGLLWSWRYELFYFGVLRYQDTVRTASGTVFSGFRESQTLVHLTPEGTSSFVDWCVKERRGTNLVAVSHDWLRERFLGNTSAVIQFLNVTEDDLLSRVSPP